MASSSVRLPWWEAEDTVQKFQSKIAGAQERVRRMGCATRVKLEARAFVLTVMVSCEAESMPARVLSTEEAFIILTKLFHEIRNACLVNLSVDARRFFSTCEHAWPWQCYLRMSGSSSRLRAACLSQMKQHLKALMFLCIYHKDKPLTAPLLRATHTILMTGFQESPAFGFRNCSFIIDGVALIHEASIASSVNDMLCRLEGEEEVVVPSSQHQPPQRVFNFPERCASLVHDMSHIRPFVHGNQWMCRIIMAFFMVKHDGFAFPVPVAPITTRTTQEFLHALFAPDNGRLQLQEDIATGFRREKALLSAYILECISESLEEVIRCNDQAYH